MKAITSLSPSESESKFSDGDWGWVIVVSCLALCLIQDGISFSFGILFDTIVTEFDVSNLAASWIGSLFVSVPLLAGPVMSILVDKYGCRFMTIVGGFVSATGFMLSAFAQSITIMYFTFGIISGLGLGLTFVTCVVPIAFWFDKRRNLAVGISACGIGIGTFIFAPFTSYLLESLGWRGAVLILAGTLLHICVIGALMRDPNWLVKEKIFEKAPLDKVSKNATDGNWLPVSATMSKILDFSFVDIPRLGTHSNSETLKTRIERKTRLPYADEIVGFSNNDTKLEDVISYSDLKRTFKSLNNLNEDLDAEKPQVGVPNSSNLQKENEYTDESEKNRQVIQPFIRTTKQNQLYPCKSALALRSSLLHLNKDNPMDHLEEADHERKADITGMSLKDIHDYSMFFNFHFFLMSLSSIILFAWFMTPYFYLPNHMIMYGYTKTEASYVTAIIGITNTIGMIGLGYGISLVLCGISCSLMVLSTTNYVLLVMMAASYGITLASNFVFTPIIVMNLIPLDKFTTAYGLVLLCQGIGHLSGPPVAGYLKDVTEFWDASFHLSAGFIVVSGLLIIAIPYTKNRQIMRKKCEESTDE